MVDSDTHLWHECCGSARCCRGWAHHHCSPEGDRRKDDPHTWSRSIPSVHGNQGPKNLVWLMQGTPGVGPHRLLHPIVSDRAAAPAAPQGLHRAGFLGSWTSTQTLFKRTISTKTHSFLVTPCYGRVFRRIEEARLGDSLPARNFPRNGKSMRAAPQGGGRFLGLSEHLQVVVSRLAYAGGIMGHCGGHQGALKHATPSQTFDAGDAACTPSYVTAAVTIFFHMAKSRWTWSSPPINKGWFAHHQPSSRRPC